MTNDRTILVTGGFGFLGRAVARKYKKLGCRVVGIGRGHWAPEEARARGFDVWLNAGVSLSSLMTLKEKFECIVHCAGNGSVGYSITNPLQDFNKTVQSTADLLEYVRLTGCEPLIVYPSSAGVYGAKPDAPIKETDELNPISPYGVHKRVAEELLAMYSRTYGVKVAIIRFFSIYGPGLTKQLLWDASVKLRSAQPPSPAVFWGTGEETRDWIFSEDAADLVVAASKAQVSFTVINGAGGIRTTVKETLSLLSEALNSDTTMSFNNQVRDGDPRFYHADVSKSAALGWVPKYSLPEGISRYVSWLSSYGENTV
jgi:UDP-glucose 4-epimerase